MAQDGMGRRSRFKRTPRGKRILLTERDIEVFRWLYRYRFLRATQLVSFIRPKSEKRFIERLGDLYHETGLIDRPAAQWRHFDARYAPIIYELSPKGIRFLDTCPPLPPRATTFARRNRAGTTPQFDHAMMIVDALAEIEIETRRTESERFVPVDEILARAPDQKRKDKRPLAISVSISPNAHLPRLKTPFKTTVVPDGLYGIEYKGKDEPLYRFWALECENKSPRRRSDMTLSSLALKRAAYDALIKSRQYRRVWGVPNLSLCVIQ